MKLRSLTAVLVATVLASRAGAGVRITEFMYNSTGTAATGEFVEFTNLGPTPVDMTGWTFDDNSRTPGSTSLAAFGTVAVGESVVLTDADAAAFKSAWSLTTTKVIGGNAENLGRSDEVNLYNATDTLVDRLTFGDQTYAGTPRTNGTSAWAYVSGDGPFGNITAAWKLAAVGDAQNSRQIANGDTGNPGIYVVPEPVGCAVIAAALTLATRRHRPRG